MIDLGPEGGEVVVTGTPEEVAEHDESHTGRYLRDLLPDVEMDGPRAERKKRASVASDERRRLL